MGRNLHVGIWACRLLAWTTMKGGERTLLMALKPC